LPIYCPVSTYLYDSTILIKGIRSVDDRLELPGLHQLPEIRDLVQTDNQRTLVAWEDGMGFEDATLLDTSGSRIAPVGEMIHGGGGFFERRGHIEQLSGQSIPDRCVPDGEDSDGFAIIYEVTAGPFE
jgi:hypothetical protein